MLRIGVVGYGTGGKHFHTPFIDAADGCELTGIVARAESTVASARADWPNVSLYKSLTEMISAGVCDAVTITTPPATRKALVLEAIEGGLHVIADKPFAPSAAGGRLLEAAAQKRGVVLSVFHNRRYDADIQTLSSLINNNRLGAVWSIHSRMDQDSPQTIEAGPDGGLLRDLGSHVVDQMLWLLGPVSTVDAQMDFVTLEEGRTDAAFTLTMRHSSGAHSHVSASKLNYVDARELRVYGSDGYYASMTTDIQAQDIFAGKRPIDDLAAWGFEPEANWGKLHTAGGIEIVPSEQGRYHDYYEQFAMAVVNGTTSPVTTAEAIRVLAVLDAARQSAQENRSVSPET